MRGKFEKQNEASGRIGCGCFFIKGSNRTEKPKPISCEINLLQLKNGLDFGVHHNHTRPHNQADDKRDQQDTEREKNIHGPTPKLNRDMLKKFQRLNLVGFR